MKFRKISTAFLFAALASLPLAGWSPVSTASAAKIDPHTPVAKYGTVNTSVKPAGIKTFSDGGASLAYEGTGQQVSASQPTFNRVNPAGTGTVGTQSVIGTDQRTQVTNTTAFPYRAIAHIESDIGGCTGWMIGPRTVATAGHCVYDPGTRRWASWAKVYPGRNGSSTPYGYANAVNFFSVSGWVQNGDTNYDYAAIKLDKDIGNSTGWIGYRWQSGSMNGIAENISGYPGDKAYGTQWQHADQIRETYTLKLHYANDTYGGQSGSPVYESYHSSCGGPCSIAVHTNGVYGGNPYNRGTRITQTVYNNFNTWKAQ
ncbi:trypsin-like serine peptidase [Staphylospora marina]|uniref:trypsin-like serine peptidase n=1 Tax=Staphylospora marina TaxID=2490858 RepID=UPI000F5BA697|nr:serine protease [Staphylospora marina]